MLIVRSYLFAAAFYVTTALFLLLGSWLLFAPRRWAMEGLRLHGLASLWLLKNIAGTRMEIRGHQHVPQGACLIVSKHQSAWDTFALVPLFRDPAIVLKDELKWIPFYGWFCVKFEHILVKRDRAAIALKALVEAGKVRIAQDRQVVIFPEGTRRTPGAPPDYKPGYVALYEGLGVTCIPLALNSGLFWPRRSLLRHPGTIVIEFLEPIPAGMPRKAFKAELEKRLEAASNRLVAESLAMTGEADRAMPNP
jgi:1-acyl-sn-glycerol-3-phosphate acyltransferase